MTDFQIAANGVAMDTNGKLIPADEISIKANSKPSEEEHPKVADRMDISIHNLADHS